MLRWRIAILVSAAIAISYLDRQTLPVAIKAISKDIPLTNVQFSNLQSAFLLAYAFMYAGGGKLADALGTRRGFIVIMLFWSLACASHGLALTFTMLAVSRFALGMGEGGGFPTATRAVAEWFSVNERATAMGIINGGTAVGAVVAPPLIALILTYANWRWIFYFTGALGLLWTAWWRKSYFPPAEHPQLTAHERDKIPQSVESSTDPKKNPLARPAPLSRNLGHSRCKIPKRRRLVLLSLLAAQISLRRAPLRHQGRRRRSLDSQRRRWRRLPPGRLVLQPPGPPKTHAERGPQDLARPERRSDADYPASPSRSHRLGHRHLQPRIFRPAILVHPSNGPADGSLSQQRSRRRRRHRSASAARWVGIAFGELAGYLLDHGFGYETVFRFAGTFHVIAFLVILVTVPAIGPLNMARKFAVQTQS